MPKKAYIRVEYDVNYCGGDYFKVGEFTLIPADGRSVEDSFVAKTGLDARHIVHYCPDELYDKDGNRLDE